jgi:class 3 adenylate cyclase/tetratricopeptide (TPR) repeat protein
MTDPPVQAQLEAAIEAQEQLRGTLGDDIVDATVGALRAQLAALERDQPVQHERRLVTVLFLDVVDSTRILRGTDPEETMAIMDTALQRLAGPVSTRGGRVTRFMGDGFLAVFGLRRTLENDAVMAVRAALDILESAREVADAVARSHNIGGFQVRIGINTGLVVTGGVTEAEDTVMGSAVNLASRIESAAPPGGILVSQATFRQVRGRFSLEPAGTIDAKGFADPVPVHLVIGEKSDSMEVAIRGGLDGVHTELIGRSDELAMLIETFNHVAKTGRGHTVTIVGDAGIGKSRLLSEFEARLADSSPVATFHARASLDGSTVPYSMLRDLMERCFGIRSDDPVPVVQEKLAVGLGARLASGPAQAAKIHIVGRFLGYDMVGPDAPAGIPDAPQALHDRATVHLIEFFRAAAATSPVLLLLDDLHWADSGSLTVLEELIEELAYRPVLVVALSRPILHDTHLAWEDLPNHRLLQLSPLAENDSETLIDAMLSRIEVCPPELRSMLLEQAGGNPYYLEELVSMCIDDGVIVVAGSQWTVRPDHLATLRLPATLTGVIQARLDGLPAPERTLLQQASVVGRVFWDEVVAQLAGIAEADAIGPQLRALQTRQMIRSRSPSAFAHAAEFAFTHTLLRDATYEAVLLETRRKYHGMVADWLIKRTPGREQELVGLIAGHLEKAGRGTEALDYLTRAAIAAWDSYAVAAAADFYERALALTAEDDLSRRYELLLGRAKAWALQGDRDAQRKTLGELEAVVDEIGEPGKQALVAVERTFLHFYTSDYRAALSAAREAASFAAETDDVALQSRTQASLAWAYVYLENLSAARLAGTKAFDLAVTAGVSHREASAENLLGMLAVAEGDLSEARTRLDRAVAIARFEGDRDAVSTYLNNLAVALTMLGDYQSAHSYFTENLDIAEGAGDRIATSTARVNLAWVSAARGDWQSARNHAEHGIRMKRRQEHVEAEAEALLWLGHALTGLGVLEDASAAYQESLAIRRRLGQTALGLGAEAGLTRVALSEGDTAKAMGHAEVILDHLDRGGTLEGTWEPLRIHLAVADALRTARDPRFRRVLRRAHDLLLHGAEKIPDPDDRMLFLEAVPWHRTILELEQAWRDEGGEERRV